MSNKTLNELLYKTIKDLHTLHLFPVAQNTSEYETLLIETIQNILQLLNYHEKSYCEINLKVSPVCPDIGSLSTLYYVNRTSPSPYSATQITNLNIFPSIQSYQDENRDVKSSRSHVLKSLVKLLSSKESSLNEKKPKRIKESFSFILIRFSELLDFFIQLHYKSEERLIQYINACFNYELNLYSNLQNQIDSKLSLNEQDTEKIVTIIDEYIGNISTQEPELNEDKELTETIFSYGTNDSSFSVLSKSPLNFQCNDPNFTNLYKLFLQISAFKNFQADPKSLSRDFSKYLRIMINLYKRSNHIDALEVNNFKFKETKFNFFYNFFVGNKTNIGSVLPEQFKDINERIISKMVFFPESDHKNNVNLLEPRPSSPNHPSASRSSVSDVASSNFMKQGEFHIPNTLVNNQEYQIVKSIHQHQMYSTEEQSILTGNLNYIIPLLNEFNFDINTAFPNILRHYMRLQYNELTEIAEEADADYINNIVSLVSTIADYENEDVTSDEFNIRDTVLQFYRLHTYLNRNEELPQGIYCTKLMRLAVHEYFIDYELKETLFRKWNYRTLAISQLEYNLNCVWLPLTNNICKKYILKKWFGKRSRIEKLESVTAKFYEKDLLAKTFNTWLPLTMQCRSMYESAYLYSLKKPFHYWIESSKRIQAMHISMLDYDRSRLLKRYFRFYHQKYLKNKEISNASLSMRQSLIERDALKLKSLIMGLWYNRMNSRIDSTSVRKNDPINEVEKSTVLKLSRNRIPPSTLSEKLIRLNNIEKYFIISKYFKVFKDAHRLQFVSNQVRIKNDAIFLKFFLIDQWLKKSKLHSVAKETIGKKLQIVKSKIFVYWKEYKELNLVADEFSRKKVVSAYFNKWKLRQKEVSSDLYTYSSRNSTENLGSGILNSYFKIWVLAYQLKCMNSKSDTQSISLAFNRWNAKLKTNENKGDQAAVFYDSNIKQKQMLKWRYSFRDKKLKDKVADLILQRKYFNKLERKYQLYADVLLSKSKSFGKFGAKKMKLADCIAISVALRKWQERYELKFQTIANSKIKFFNATVTFPTLMSKYFVFWVNEYNDNSLNIMRLDNECEKFNQKSISKRHFFNKWTNMARRKKQLNSKAEEFEGRLLSKKFLVIWYDQFLHVNQYLNEISDDFISQKEFNKYRDILSNWSMKYIKNIRRNQQSCDLFIERWQNVKSRSILELWLYKLRERDNLLNSSADSVKDTSIINNQSPLAKKSSQIIASKMNTYSDGNTSYLYTPLKSKASPTPLTPYSSRTANGNSPTKLQETTLRLKNERIDELRKHFGKAKATSTPRKGANFDQNTNQSVNSKLIDRNNSKFIRLSPPKSKYNRSIVPPEPPNFSVSEFSNTYNLTSVPRETSVLTGRSSAMADEDEKSLIETAKRLRRITPIFIPTESETQEPRFSPVKKLKEKLRNIDASPRRSRAEVFDI